MIQSISNWNNYPSVKATVVASGNTEDLADLLNSSKNIIARGNGRSYGDASLNDRVFSTLDLNRIIDFDIT
ncbi:MAG: FAD-binding oxidoreductase [Saprospiraceae bacterium]|nr:FAD-binding oxidoreductase [Saprospiraceae bacterium]